MIIIIILIRATSTTKTHTTANQHNCVLLHLSFSGARHTLWRDERLRTVRTANISNNLVLCLVSSLPCLVCRVGTVYEWHVCLFVCSFERMFLWWNDAVVRMFLSVFLMMLWCNCLCVRTERCSLISSTDIISFNKSSKWGACAVGHIGQKQTAMQYKTIGTAAG